MARPEAVAALASARIVELRHNIDYLAATVALLPAGPQRAAARAAVRAIDRDITDLLGHLGVTNPSRRPAHRT